MFDDTDNSDPITEPITWTRPEPAALRVIAASRELEARVVAPGTMTFLGYVPDEAPFTVCISLKVNEHLVALNFDKTMGKEEMLEAFRKALPEGYEIAGNEGSQSEVLIVDVFNTVALRPEPMHFVCSDERQIMIWAGSNKFVVTGKVAGKKSCLSLKVGKQVVKVNLCEGDQPIVTANRVRAALPEDLTAIIELPFTEGSDVSVTVMSKKNR
ncbi:MAG: hypothetical protein QM723_37670 [Myxococcaceae bacterium]